MPELSLEVKRSRGFLLNPPRTSVQCRLLIGPDAASLPLERLAKAIFFENDRSILEARGIRDSEEITNIRGRPAETVPGRTVSAASKRREELFSFSGLVPHETDSGETAGQSKLSFSLETEFTRFSDQGDIVHRIYPSISPEFDELLPWAPEKFFLELFPFELQEVRFGYELYRKHRLGGMFGMLPDVLERVYCTLRRTNFELFWERMAKIESPWSDAWEFVPRANRALAACGVYSGLLQRIEQELSPEPGR